MEILVCPACKAGLTLEAFKESEQIDEGLLTCSCGQWFPIIRGVPRMLLGALRPDFSAFQKKHSRLLPKLAATVASARQKAYTRKSFSLEWKAYAKYGWEGRGEDREISDDLFKASRQERLWSHTVRTFWRKTLLKPEEVKGKLVLDVGVGNGRYAQACHDAGAEVIGIDLSEAVDVAYRNTEGRVDTVQCDIFALPFRQQSFDVVYSIGVLHHTPNTFKAQRSISEVVRNGGILSIHLYHKGNPVYEATDASLRFFSVRLPLQFVWYASYLPAALGRIASLNRFLYAGLNAFIVLRSNHHTNFDWYSAPVAYHHTEEEVAGWYKKQGFRNIRGDNPVKHGHSYFARIYPKFARKRDGRVKGWAAALVPSWALTVRGVR